MTSKSALSTSSDVGVQSLAHRFTVFLDKNVIVPRLRDFVPFSEGFSSAIWSSELGSEICKEWTRELALGTVAPAEPFCVQDPDHRCALIEQLEPGSLLSALASNWVLRKCDDAPWLASRLVEHYLGDRLGRSQEDEAVRDASPRVQALRYYGEWTARITVLGEHVSDIAGRAPSPSHHRRIETRHVRRALERSPVLLGVAPSPVGETMDGSIGTVSEPPGWASPARDVLPGPTYGDNLSRALARSGFLQELMEIPFVKRLHGLWAIQLGIDKDLTQVRRTLAITSRQLGIRDLRTLALHGPDDEFPDLACADPESRRRLKDVLECRSELQDRIHGLGADGPPDGLVPHPSDLIASWGTDWPWLAITVWQAMCTSMLSYLHGVTLQHTFWLPEPSMPSDCSFNFEPRLGETLEQATKRLDRESRAYRRLLRDGCTPRGRVPDLATEKVSRHGSWACKRLVRRQSIRRIAYDAYPDATKPTDRRNDVKAAIEKTVRLLAS